MPWRGLWDPDPLFFLFFCVRLWGVGGRCLSFSVCVCDHICGSPISFLHDSPIFVFWAGSLTELRPIRLSRLAGQWTSRICLSLQGWAYGHVLPCWSFTWVLGIFTPWDRTHTQHLYQSQEAVARQVMGPRGERNVIFLQNGHSIKRIPHDSLLYP